MRFSRVKLAKIGILILLFLTEACSPSPSPSSEELVKTAMPTFDGSQNYSATTPTMPFVLLGVCDTKSYGLEYSYDGSSWSLLSNDCASGRFTIHLIVRAITHVFVRAKTKMGHTESAKATIRFVLPPTSPSFQFVSSSNAVDSTDKKIQFTSSLIGSEGHFSSSIMNMQTGITGMTYYEP